MNTPEAKAAYINSQVAAAMIEAMAMQAENAQREQQGYAQAWPESCFMELIQKYGLDHNSVVSFLKGID